MKKAAIATIPDTGSQIIQTTNKQTGIANGETERMESTIGAASNTILEQLTCPQCMATNTHTDELIIFD